MLLFFNDQEYDLPLSLENNFRRIYSGFLERFKLPIYDVELLFVSEEEITKLNREHRGKDCSTDVLSFPISPSSFENVLGSIVFCYSEIKKNNIDLEHEFNLLFSHSLLHLIGYEHGEEMFRLQEDLMRIGR